MARWINWKKKPIEERRNRLQGLGIYPRRRPVMDITEELGGKPKEGAERLPDCSGGEGERDLSISDVTREIHAWR